jgi:hypothetical protein
MLVVALFLYSDLLLPIPPPSNWVRLFWSQTFSRINTSTFSTLVILHTYLPVKMGQIVPKQHTKFRRRGITQKHIQHSEHDENLKSRICMLLVKVSTIRYRLQSSHNNGVHKIEKCDFKKLRTLSLCTLFIWVIKRNFTSICIILPKEANNS